MTEATQTIIQADEYRWGNAEKTSIDARVLFDGYLDALPYTFIEADWPKLWPTLIARTDLAPYVAPPVQFSETIHVGEVWLRTTEDEAHAIERAVGEATARERGLFNSTQDFLIGGPAHAALVAIVGRAIPAAARAAEIIAPPTI